LRLFLPSILRRYLEEPAYGMWAHAAALPPSRLASGCRPLDPCKGKKAKAMKAENRSAWIKLRVSPAEKEAIVAKAEAQGQSLTDFLRQRALDYRLRQTPLEKERVRQLVRIGSNLNQLARWANMHKSRAEALDVLVALVSLEREARAMPEDACT
jgi:hypothetical protein